MGLHQSQNTPRKLKFLPGFTKARLSQCLHLLLFHHYWGRFSSPLLWASGFSWPGHPQAELHLSEGHVFRHYRGERYSLFQRCKRCLPDFAPVSTDVEEDPQWPTQVTVFGQRGNWLVHCAPCVPVWRFVTEALEPECLGQALGFLPRCTLYVREHGQHQG